MKENLLKKQIENFMDFAWKSNLDISAMFNNLNNIGFREAFLNEYFKLSFVSDYEKNCLFELCNLGKGNNSTISGDYDIFAHVLDNRGKLVLNSLLIKTILSSDDFLAYVSNAIYFDSTMYLNKEKNCIKFKFNSDGLKEVIAQFKKFCESSAKSTVYIKENIQPKDLKSNSTESIRRIREVNLLVEVELKKYLKQHMITMLDLYRKEVRNGEVLKAWLVDSGSIKGTPQQISKAIKDIDFNSYDYEKLISIFTSINNDNIIIFLSTINYINTRLKSLTSLNKTRDVLILDILN